MSRKGWLVVLRERLPNGKASRYTFDAYCFHTRKDARDKARNVKREDKRGRFVVRVEREA